jgi:hypothetical protein
MFYMIIICRSYRLVSEFKFQSSLASWATSKAGFGRNCIAKRFFGQASASPIHFVAFASSPTRHLLKLVRQGSARAFPARKCELQRPHPSAPVQSPCRWCFPQAPARLLARFYERSSRFSGCTFSSSIYPLPKVSILSLSFWRKETIST